MRTEKRPESGTAFEGVLCQGMFYYKKQEPTQKGGIVEKTEPWAVATPHPLLSSLLLQSGLRVGRLLSWAPPPAPPSGRHAQAPVSLVLIRDPILLCLVASLD